MMFEDYDSFQMFNESTMPITKEAKRVQRRQDRILEKVLSFPTNVHKCQNMKNMQPPSVEQHALKK